MTGITFLRNVFAVALIGVMPGVAMAETGALNETDPERGFSRVWRDYPDMDAEFSRDGQSRSLAQIQGIQIGQSKAQLVRHAGQPVSSSADGAWNFNVKLPLPQRNQLVCQFKVYFDDQEKVAETVWRRPQCAALVKTGRAQG